MHLLASPSDRCVHTTTDRSATTDPQPERRLSVLTARLKPLVPRWWVEVGLVAGLYILYEVIRGFQSATVDDADRTGWALLRWEQRWHLAFESSLNTGLHHLPALAVLCSYYYATLHFVVTPIV